jgi:hypothetical protein
VRVGCLIDDHPEVAQGLELAPQDGEAIRDKDTWVASETAVCQPSRLSSANVSHAAGGGGLGQTSDRWEAAESPSATSR